MTRDELMAEISAELHMNAAAPLGDYGKGRFEALEEVLRRLEQLDSPPAMTWQAEPSQLPMDAHVEGIGVAKVHCDDYGEIVFSTAPVDGEWHDCVPLNGRRVCPIPAPPALPKRGDA